MVSITTHQDCRTVQRLPFCYLCGQAFLPGGKQTRDHLPPDTVFALADKQKGPVLWLPAHKPCNEAEAPADQKLGQLIGLRRFEVPASRRDRQLKFTVFPRQALGAITNVNIDQAIWRWVRGFHTALYREHMPNAPMRALTTPFPRAQQQTSGAVIEPMKEPQHRVIVKTIKTNRAKRNLDLIHTHDGKLRYEAVWVQSDQGMWMCFFGLDIYDWIDLGDAGIQQRRGCAGCYALPDGGYPASATRAVSTPIIVPNLHPLDPFGP
jgi:hypothetical protein